MSSEAFRQLLEEGDVDGLRRAWSALFPSMPQPESREQAEIMMHRARTEAESVSMRARTCSHSWLSERLLPSGLPDHLQPAHVVEAVGVAVRFSSEHLRPAAHEIQREVNIAIEDAYADGHKDVGFIKRRMEEARARTVRTLFGR